MTVQQNTFTSLKFNKQDKPEFYAEVKAAVAHYFEKNGISKHANRSMMAKSLFFFSALIILYALIITETFSPLVNLFLVMLLGVSQTFVAFNISHDAIHGSYSANQRMNKWLGYTYEMMGLSSYVWRMSHNKVHHSYTNIPEHDEDLDVAPGLIRLSPTQELKPHMRFQQYYAFLLYLLTSLSWVLRKDYVKMAQSKIGQTMSPKHPLKEYVILYVSKAFYYTLFIVLPLIVLSITWQQFLIGFLAMHFSQGLMAALVFQLAHTVEDTDYSQPDEQGFLEESWVSSQLRGTANFSVNSKLATFFFGGLNYQIEHHLFPSVCHIHYPEISKIVRRLAEKHRIPYHVNRTFASAIVSHFRMLKKFGS